MKENNIFLQSALTVEGSFMKNRQVVDWLKAQNEKVAVGINRIPFRKLKLWQVGHDVIRHDTGKFFSIIGINIRTNWGTVSEWEQPIINQPEIGFLGFITKEFDGVLHFLMQAKIEPGNINHVQLSPTLQATKSNYTKAHKGNAPRYLDYFRQVKPEQVLLDQLQSEQGARFLKKRNRNIIIKTDEEIPVYDNFIWLTLGQIKALMNIDNVVNMDTRTVISGIPFGSYQAGELDLSWLKNSSAYRDTIRYRLLESVLINDKHLHSIDTIISFITNLKSIYELDIKQIPLSSMKQWVYDENEIRHQLNKYFKVIAVDVEIGNREVVGWTQPMIEPAQEGLCAFICKKINGILHFAVQVKLECGNFDIVELAPTVQSLTGDYKERNKIPLLFLDEVLNAAPSSIIYDSYQSEEGGRFYREQNRNMIMLADEDFPVELPENFIWMTLNQLYVFLKFNNYLNIQARNLIASLSFI
ncbi:MAG: NDP-hexose 2,3-dehydratase family protein [Prevotellaceae bacterium]|jgi:oxidase EvaA|nr:NDP-hexose 2,3-dehydratase family protein [Prevotellaceae bacterium]